MPFFKGIHFYTSGVPARPAVVFLHGFMGSGYDWNDIIQEISGEYFCIAIDLPGHGESVDLETLENVWDFSKLCHRIDALTSHLGIQKFSLVGYSMGGRVAFNFALSHHTRLLRLMVESSSPGIKSKSERQQRLNDDERLSERLLNLPLEKFLEIWYQLPVFSELKQHTNYQQMVNQRLKNDRKLLSKALTTFSTGRHSYLVKKLSSLKIPVCLVCGEKDFKYVQLYSIMKSDNPDFKLNVVKNCSHNTHFEQPNQFAEDLKQFLSL